MLRRTLLTVPLALASSTLAVAPAGAAGPAPARPGARVLTVMTFNIHHGEGSDGVLDLERIAAVIRDSGADVIGLQEVDRHYSERSDWADQPAELADLLGMHVVFGANIDRDPPVSGVQRIQYGTAILSRHPILESENIPLFRSPDQEQRGLLRASLDVAGTPVDVCCTHLAASSAVDRLEQARQIIERIDTDGATILMGDLNARPGTPEIQIIDDVLVDTWDAAGHGTGATYPVQDPDARIDDIFVTESFRPVRAMVLADVPEASDHLPVLSQLVLAP
ncbi:metal-dependent hydrolase [Brachybacterium phenoliresistens]|uniref:Metal-dependent hydrolase n=1 Tax=Brachybacterium phenoliresistens TaxID=396014 RepID=Z9JT97_9MICO|nr:endonuclease/exonuclease/phosphatase family protein [Brachybacterium phenoliresistens]EWS81575.1 metal-dependent hydrolase [Brachybacterium phenoliresistens]